MGLTEATKRDLEAELAHVEGQHKNLLARRAELDSQIAALAALIGSIRGVLGPTTLMPQGATLQVEPLQPQEQPELGFRDVIRDILRENPQGLRPRDVTLAVRNRGVTSGKLDLSQRVANELWRMHHQGKLAKTADGRYLLPPEGGK
jgi:hypothetical protein